MIIPQQRDDLQEPFLLPYGQIQARGGIVVFFSDADLLTAMGVWLLSSASYRTRVELRPNPIAWDFLTTASPQNALDAGAVLSHALIAQPEDLNRLIESKHFRDGAFDLLAAAWATGPVTPLPVTASEPATIEADAWRWWKRNWHWALPLCAAGWGTLALLMWLGGAH